MADAGSPRRDPGRFRARVLEVTSFSEIAREIERTDSDPEGVGIMTRKARVFPIRLEGVPLKASPLLKQELLAVGAEAAHARGVADHSVDATTVVVLATWGQYHRVIPKLTRQPFQLGVIATALQQALQHYTSHATRKVQGLRRSFTVGAKTLVMGVLNVTPDSFSDGGKFLDPAVAAERARQMVTEGADLVDVGGESTRPGATALSPQEEWARIAPVLEQIGKDFPVPISVDTRSPEVAMHALENGADVLNDVSGLRDAGMREVAARTGAPVVVMHMRGTPGTMQGDTHYADLRAEVYGALASACESAVAAGVRPEQLLIDPGLGFGKTGEQNVEILTHIGEFRSLGPPVVVGASRKSFLGALTQGADVNDRLEAGLAAAVVAALHGVHIVRTHDVRPTVRALAVADAVRSSGGRLTSEGRWAEAEEG
ncbi:MAG TPA: dihydropteroate synthase [Thermoplasmata archaeon]|nr:dihydropteroate synthase [Thermoplasmata archaeon]